MDSQLFPLFILGVLFILIHYANRNKMALKPITSSTVKIISHLAAVTKRNIEYFPQKLAIITLTLPITCIASISAAEAEKISNDGADFARELKVIERCDSGFQLANTYRDAVLKHYLWKMGSEKEKIFHQSLQATTVSVSEIADRDCTETLFNAGKRRQSIGVALAVKNNDEKLIPKTLTGAESALLFASQIEDEISTHIIMCVPDVHERRRLLFGFRPLVLDYMQHRFNLRPGFENSRLFSAWADLFGYESETPPKPEYSVEGLCPHYIFKAGETIRLLEQLSELKPNPTGIWLDRHLRGVK